jgi:putative glutamine amidotransferase
VGKFSLLRIGMPRWRALAGGRTGDYVRSITQAGGDFRYLEPSPDADVKSQLEGIRGLMLSGGADVDSAVYGQKRHHETDLPHPFRDKYDMALLEEALRRDIPVLAICRAHQLLNVFMGGELVQHIPDNSHRADEETRESAWHTVSLTPGSRLASILGDGQVRVNSRHHQGVAEDIVGRGLRVTSVSPDGWIEGLEGTDQRWLVGVQWHPERQEMAESMAGLFRAFVEAARDGDRASR